MKKLLCLLLSLILLGSFVACADPDGSDVSTDPETSSPAESTEPEETTPPDDTTEAAATESEETTPEAETPELEYRELDETKAPTVKKVAWFPNELSSPHPTEEELTNFMFQAFVLYEMGAPYSGYLDNSKSSATYLMLDSEYYRNKDYFYRVMSSYFKYPSIGDMYIDWECGNPVYEHDIVAIYSKLRGYPGDGCTDYIDYTGINIDSVVYEEDRITFNLLYYWEELDYSIDPEDAYSARVFSVREILTREDSLWKLNITSGRGIEFTNERTAYDTAYKGLIPLFDEEDTYPKLFDPKKVNTKEKKAVLPDYDGKLDPKIYHQDEDGNFQYIINNRATATTLHFTENTFSMEKPSGAELANYLSQAFYFLSFTKLSYGSVYRFPSAGKQVGINGASGNYLAIDPTYADGEKFAEIMNSYITGDWTGGSAYDIWDNKSYVVEPSDGLVKVDVSWQFKKNTGIDHLLADYDILYEEQDTIILRAHFFRFEYNAGLQSFICMLTRGEDGLWRIDSKRTSSIQWEFDVADSGIVEYIQEHGADEFFEKGE